MSINCLLYEIKVFLKKVSEQLLYWQRVELTAEEAVTRTPHGTAIGSAEKAWSTLCLALVLLTWHQWYDCLCASARRCNVRHMLPPGASYCDQ